MPARANPEPPQNPAGPYIPAETHSPAEREGWIGEIGRAPARLRGAVSDLTDGQLDTTYRNWTIRQIAHHLADSHLNSYVRFKLALTEEHPAIKPYDESLWSALADARGAPVACSLAIMEGVHARWTYLARSLPVEAFERTFYHPESRDVVPLWRALALYAWHGRHHTAQIEWVRAHKL
jgi:uncharacterized damage-inducible protein DinB